jgi:hypothetical protein
MASFGDAFAGDLGGLLEEVVVGMGPCGELRYPSYVEANGWRFPGVGEFQCYDRRALASLAAAARERGHPEWGYSGPHDSGEYNSSPHDTGFFAPDGSWDSAYGDFFLRCVGVACLPGRSPLGPLSRELWGLWERDDGPAVVLLRQVGLGQRSFTAFADTSVDAIAGIVAGGGRQAPL